MSDTIDIQQLLKNNNFKLYILNEKNKFITNIFLNSIFKKYNLNHTVKNLALFQTAMNHVAYKNNNSINEKTAKILKDVQPIDEKYLNSKNLVPLQETEYGTLEFEGDSVIHHCLAKYLRKRYPEKDEGFLTKLRTKIEKSDTLSKLAKIIGLAEYAVIPRNMEYANAREENIHLTEDLFESFIGALSDEISFEQIYNFFVNLIQDELDFAEIISIEDNYKDQLMQEFHKLKWSEPKYIEDLEYNNYNSQKGLNLQTEQKIYKIYVKNPQGDIMGTGIDSSKAKAQKVAAKNCLINMDIIKDNEDENNEDYYGILNDNNNNNQEEIYQIVDDDNLSVYEYIDDNQ
jgi:ribonuclease-3